MTYANPSTIDTDSLLGFLTYLNSVTGGFFVIGILLSLYLISLSIYYKINHDFTGGMALAGFLTFIVSLFFWLGDFLSVYIFIIVITMTIIGIVAMVIDQN